MKWGIGIVFLNHSIMSGEGNYETMWESEVGMWKCRGLQGSLEGAREFTRLCGTPRVSNYNV